MLWYAVFALLLGWLVVLTIILFRTRSHYINLVSRTKKQKIDEILDRLLEQEGKLLDEDRKIREDIENIKKDVRTHFQKVGLVRFNPFGRTGGSDQSFVLALLDKDNTGVIINFIYTHEGVRVYAKHVVSGKGKEYQLSAEEEKTIQESA